MTTKRIRKDKPYFVTLEVVLYRRFAIDASSKREAIQVASRIASNKFGVSEACISNAKVYEREVKSQ